MTPLLPIARRTDPAGSHFAAAATMDSRWQKSECAEIRRVLEATGEPMTYKELHRALRGRIPEAVEVMRRLNDLRASGLVTASGSKVRRCNVSGRPVQVWEVAA